MKQGLVAGMLSLSLLAGCASTPVPPPVSVPEPSVKSEEPASSSWDTIYDSTNLAELSFSAAITDEENRETLVRNGLEFLLEAQNHCDTRKDCENVIHDVLSDFLTHVIPDVVQEQNDDLENQTQEGSKWVDPETPTIRPGDDITKLVEMNGPIHRTIVHYWLNTNRDKLVSSYVRFKFIEELVKEHYDRAGLPLALGFGILAQETFVQQLISRAGAAGPWQIMPRTAELVGKISRDERYHLVRATEAHVKIFAGWLEDLGGDILLTVAGYNGGPGRMQRLSRNGKHSVWNIYHRLPRETRDYVPKVAAAAALFHDIETNQNFYNVTVPDIDSTLIPKTIPEKASLEELGACLGNTVEMQAGWLHVLTLVNYPYAEERRRHIPEGTELLIPKMAMESYESKCFQGPLWEHLVEIRPVDVEHVVTKGQTVGVIKDRYWNQCRASIRQIADRNDRIRAPQYLIHPGQKVLVPCKS